MANIFKAKTLVGRTGIFSHEVIAPNLVYNTGYQNIDGLKDFTIRPTVGTIPVLLSGEVSTTISGVLYSAQINIKNNNGSTIYKGQPVYVSSAAGTNILVKLASNSGEQTSSKTLGLVYQTSLAQNAQGTIVTEGLLQGFNTNAGEEGDPIWLGPSGSLIFGLANKPYAPNHLVYLGVLTRKHANQGEVFVKIQNGFELEELHNVNINHRNTLADKNIIRYDSLSGIWFNDKIDSVLPDSIVYNTGNQVISGTKTFANNLEVQGTGVFNAIDLNNVDILSISGVDVSIVNGNVSLTNRPTVNGTGVVLSGELERIIINSGSLLNEKINSLSGYVNSQNLIFSGQIFDTGSSLDNKINALSGSAVLTYGSQNVYGIKYFYSGVVITGDGSTNGGYSLVAKNSAGTNGLQFNPTQEGGAGNLYFNAGTTSRLYNVGDSTLQFYANSNQYRVANSLTIGNGSDIADHTVYVVNRYGYFGIGSGFSNPLERLHVSGGNLRVDGKILLSGNLVLTGVDLTSYATNSAINSLSGQVVFTTGNQIISGIKTFIDNTVFGDPSQDDFLVISGNTFTIYGSGNFTNGLFVSGVPVVTGLPNWYATSANLALTGSILNNKINNLSGYINSTDSNIVFTTGNQNINGRKNFVNTGVFGESSIRYTPLTSNPLSVVASGNTFVQLNIQNLAIGDAASSDLVLTSNAGTDDSFYLDLGINNSGYNQAAYNIGNSGDGYLYVHGGNLTIGTQSPNRTIKFHTDGTTSINQIAEINSTGYFSPNKSVIANTGIFGINNRVLNTAGAFIGGGCNNFITRLSNFSPNNSSIVGGQNNIIAVYSDNSFIGGGTGNSICSTCFGFIGGGCSNRISTVTSNMDYNFIGNGRGNSMGTTPCHSTILNGISNTTFGCHGIILNGCLNTTSSMSVVGGCRSTASFVGGGENYNFVYGPVNSGLGTYGITFGAGNRNENNYSSVLGGCCNMMMGISYSENNVIAGGGSNCIGACSSSPAAAYYAKYNFIGGGLFNRITGSVGGSDCANLSFASVIVGGSSNSISADYSAILGGRASRVCHHGATVIGDGAARIKNSVGACTLALDFCCGISLANNILFDATPQVLTVRNNFNITTGYNSRMILVNSAAAPITGFLTSGQVNGFNASLVQIGAGQIQITGSGIGVTFNSYNNQYKSAGIYSTISVLHTGNDGYIMYGNTA